MRVVCAALVHRRCFEEECYFADLIRRSACAADVSSVHVRIAERGLAGHSRYLSNLLIDAYGRLGTLQDAWCVFESTPRANLHTWNMLLAASARHQHLDVAWSVFQEMPQRDSVSWNTILGSFLHLGNLEECVEVFERMPKQSVVAWTALMQALAYNGQLLSSSDLFRCMPERSVLTWAVLIDAFCENGFIERAKVLIEMMPQWNLVSWTLLIGAYGKERDLISAKKTFIGMPQRDEISWIELLQACVGADRRDDARDVYDLMPHHCLVVWNIGIASEVAAAAEDLVFESMPERDLVSWNALLRRESATREIDRVMFVSKRMPMWDLVTWNTTLQACVHCLSEEISFGFQSESEAFRNAEGLFFGRIQGFSSFTQRDAVSWNLMIQAYVDNGRSAAAKATFDRMPAHDVISGTLIVSLHARSGKVDEAKLVFDSMKVANVFAWTALIEASVRRGDLGHAGQLLCGMNLEGVRPNETTFTTLLVGFSHAGMLKEGRECLVSVAEVYGEAPSLEHYCCMIDILGRCKQLEEAKDLIGNMPLVPHVAAWTSLLGACRVHGDVQGGAIAAERILEMDSEYSATYVLLSNTYSSEFAE